MAHTAGRLHEIRAGAKSASFALLLGVSVFALYAFTLPPSFAFWDVGELQTVSWILGIAHPPACPAFVLAGYLFSHAIPFGNPAWRLDLMCAAAVALSVALLYVVGRAFELSRTSALLAALGFGLADITWRYATRAEVQDLSLLLRVLAFAAALRWLQRGEPVALFCTGLATGLAGATHGIALLLLPSLGVVVAARPGWRRPRALALLGAGLALGLLPYAYLPLRSAWIQAHHLDPTVALGLPPGQPFWDYDHPATWANFARVVTASDFNVRSGFGGFVSPLNYSGYAVALVRQIGGAYGLAGIWLAALGGYVLAASRRVERIALVAAALLPIPFTIAYSELQDRDRYYLFTLWCAALAIGAGLDLVLGFFTAAHSGRVARSIVAGVVAASFVAAGPSRAALFAQRDDDWPQRYVAQVEDFVPDGAVVVAEWAYATPLAYAAYVDRDFGRRVLVTAGARQYAAAMPGWLAHRAVYVISFDADLRLPRLHTEPVYGGWYYAYRVTEEAASRRPATERRTCEGR